MITTSQLFQFLATSLLTIPILITIAVGVIAIIAFKTYEKTDGRTKETILLRLWFITTVIAVGGSILITLTAAIIYMYSADISSILKNPQSTILSAEENNGDLKVTLGTKVKTTYTTKVIFGKETQIAVETGTDNKVTIGQELINFLEKKKVSIAGIPIEKAIAQTK